jgi:MFS family permease
MKGNYQKLIIASAIVYASMGIFTPAWYLFLSQKNGALQFGLALGIMAIAGGVASYFFGRFSDTRNKPIILSGSYFALAFVVSAYTFTPPLFVIYILQFFYGIISAVILLLENVLASIYTPEKQRGEGMGLFSGIQQVVIGVSMILGGGLANIIGINGVFFTTSVFLIIGGVVALQIKTNG